MYIENTHTIHGSIDAMAAYIDEYRNCASMGPLVATDDYRHYFCQSLLFRDFLFANSKTIEDMFRVPLEEIYTERFRAIFLYSLEREFKGVYRDFTEVKKLKEIGVFDYLSSLLTPNTAKMFPLMEPSKLTMLDLVEKMDITQDELEEEFPEEETDFNIYETEMVDDEPMYYKYSLVDKHTMRGERDPDEIYYTLDEIEESMRECADEDFDELLEFKPELVYYTREIVPSLPMREFTEEQIMTVKTKKIVKILQKFMHKQIDLCLLNFRYCLQTEDPLKFLLSVNANNGTKDYKVVKLLYNSLISVIYGITVYISLADYFAENPDEIYNSLTKTFENLQNARNLKNFLGIQEYFDRQVLNKLYSPETLSNDCFIRHPLISNFDTGELAATTAEVSMVYCKNWMNLSTVLKEKLNQETSFNDKLAMFLTSTVFFFDLFQVYGYLTKNMEKKDRFINDLFKRFNIDLTKIIRSKIMDDFMLNVVFGGDKT